MVSPLGLVMTNVLLSQLEQNWLHKCPIEFKPTLKKSYVNDFFLLLNHLNLPTPFVNVCPLNTKFQC